MSPSEASDVIVCDLCGHFMHVVKEMVPIRFDKIPDRACFTNTPVIKCSNEKCLNTLVSDEVAKVMKDTVWGIFDRTGEIPMLIPYPVEGGE